MKTRCRRLALILVVVLQTGLTLVPAPAAAQSQMTWAVHVSIAPTWFDPAVGPRVEESGIGLIAYHPYSAPYEDLRLRK